MAPLSESSTNREVVLVLLIEDNPGDAVLIEAALERSIEPDFEVHVEKRLAPALERLASERFQVVLLDLNLPDSRGFDTVTAVQSALPNTPVVIITGDVNEEFARKAIQAGAQDYLSKDEIRAHSLVRSISFAMERKRTERELHALEHVASAAAATLDLQSLLDTMLATLRTEMESDRAALLLVHDGVLSEEAQAGTLQGIDPSSFIEVEEKLNRQVLLSGQPSFDQLRNDAGDVLRTVLKVPLVIGGLVSGVVEVEWAGAHAERPRETYLMTVAAERIASGVANSQAYESVKRSERRSQEERSRLRAIMDTLPVGILITDAEGRQLESNILRSRMFGGTPLPSKSIEDLCRIKAWYLDTGDPVEECPIVKALKYGVITLGEAIIIERLDGNTSTILNSAAPIRDPNGVLIGAVGVQQDISERIRLEQDLKVAMERGEFYIDLLTHDVNNALTVTSGYLQLARGSDGANDRVVKWLDNAMASINDSARLIDTVRKVHRSGQSLQKVKVDLDVLLPEIIGQVLSMERGEVEIAYSGTHDATVIGTELLPDLFINIIGNAVKHSSGRIAIVVTVRPQLRGGIEYLRVEVADNGPGIPDDIKDRLFVKGERGLSRAPGQGLGLFLVSNIVAEAGGKIWVEDRVPGDHARGSRFVVLLPRGGEQARA
ncbi:MAG: response regulator [Methanomassiliicoccus sp.]|nr:response regulator [Methanomassiliicoccus sp.]